MNWTEDKPKVAGWYRVRYKGEGPNVVNFVEVVNWDTSEGMKLHVLDMGRGDLPLDHANFEGAMWAGPMPEPGEQVP